MRNIKHTILMMLVLFAFATGMAQKQTPPPGGAPKDFKLSEKKKTRLPNGLNATYVQYGSVPKVSISLQIATGSIHESLEETGLAVLVGELLKQGSKSTDFKTLAKKVAAMGGTVNVGVGKENISIAGSVLSEFAPEFIAAIADLVMNPAFPASELDRLKDNMQRQLAVDMTVPQSVAENNFRKQLFGDHPFGILFSTKEKINGLTVEKVKGFYDKNFGARRSALYVVGNFNQDAVNAAVTKSFGGWKQGPEVYTPPVTPIAKQDTVIIDRKDAPQTTLLLGLPTIAPDDKDYMALYVVDALLGGAFGSRITSNIREQKGYTYSPYSSIMNRKGVSVWTQIADVTSEHTIDALQEIEKEIRRLQAEPPSEEELKGIQSYLAGLFVLQNSSPVGIIGQLSFMDKHNLPDSYLANYVKDLNSVTPQQVSDIAKKYLDYNKMTVVMVGNEQLIRQQAAEKKQKKAF